MKKIPFVKYTSYGNNFVIVDGTVTQTLAESELSRFAYEATNSCFGIGCDNLLVIQRLDHETLRMIQQERGYWTDLPDSQGTEFIFRMFEPNGEEAFSCGNGLMCIAAYLDRRHGIRSAKILTEIPFEIPKCITIGSTGTSSWANLDHPRRVPPELADPMILRSLDHDIDFVRELNVHFRSHDLEPYTADISLNLSGYLIFTGEPHLVIFPDHSFANSELAQTIFDYSASHVDDVRQGHRRANFGSWLINRIGSYINTHGLDHFPAGLNVNFARTHDTLGVVEYRCFERGINRETLACGTGALAVAYIARCLGLVGSTPVNVLPHQCRQYQPEAQIEVRQQESGWMLNGCPAMLVEGTFMLNSPRVVQGPTPRARISGEAATSIREAKPGYSAIASS
ncbi:MAG: diaminopimelate epimerase [Gammaproteobacteria bacterium]|nr:diaminopimelate epimerase [Gammaproteobacteria bacterium]